jgi:membrane associated rhomboid family serine protease
MALDPASLARRWPYSAAATFVAIMWIAYAWAIWVAGGVSAHGGGLFIGRLTAGGYDIAGQLDTEAIVEHGAWERLISGIFLHGGIVHILFNSAAILQLGRILEAFTTRGRCWLTLLISGLCGSLMTVAWAGLTAHPALAVGASGAAAGLGTALLVLSLGIPALEEFRKQVTVWVVVVLAMGLIPMISGTGHFGGAIGGAIAGLLVRRRGTMVVRNDPYSRRLDLLTAALTALFLVALVLNAASAPARKADFERIDARIDDVYAWIDQGRFPPDVDAWVESFRSEDLHSLAAQSRAWILTAVDLIERSGNGGGMHPKVADVARNLLSNAQAIRGE